MFRKRILISVSLLLLVCLPIAMAVTAAPANRLLAANSPAYTAIRQAVVKAATDFSAAKTDLLSAQAALRQNTGNPPLLRTALMAKANSYVLNQNKLFREKASELTALGLTVPEEVVTESTSLDSEISRATDAPRLVGLSTSIQNRWRTLVHSVVLGQAISLNARYQANLDKANQLISRLESVSLKLKENNRDTSLFDRGISQLKTDTAAFESAYADLRTQFQSASTDRDKALVLAKARRVLRIVHARFAKDLVLLRSLIVLQAKLNAGVQTEIDTVSTAVTTAISQIEAQPSLESQVAQAEIEAETEINAILPATPESGGDDA